MLKAKHLVNLQIYASNSCICNDYTANHFKFGQELLGLTLRVKSLVMKLGPGHTFIGLEVCLIYILSTLTTLLFTPVLGYYVTGALKRFNKPL